MVKRGYKIVAPSLGPRPEGEEMVKGLPEEREEYRAVGKIGARIVTARCETEEELMEVTEQADGILVGGNVTLSRRTIENLEQCQVIVRYGIGVDNIDVEAATECGIVVANAADFCVEEVANHAIMLLLASAKKLTYLHKKVRSGIWSHELLPPMPTIYGETLGLVGYGKLGRATGRKAKAFEMQVLAYDPYGDKAEAWEDGVDLYRSGLEKVLREADYVSLHVPHTEETHHLIGEDELRAMKPTAFLINTSRGAVVDEKAIIRALKKGWIAGAGLDVFEEEPVAADNPLLQMENVVVTPHSASYSDEAFTRLRIRVGEEAARVLRGHWPLCLVNPEVKSKVSFS